MPGLYSSVELLALQTMCFMWARRECIHRTPVVNHSLIQGKEIAHLQYKIPQGRTQLLHYNVCIRLTDSSDTMLQRS